MAGKRSFIELSRDGWVPTVAGDISLDQLKVGCLQRIAFSLEAIARTQASLLALEKNRASRLERRVRKLETK